MNYWLLWLIVVILLSIVEALTVNLVTIWFIASGILAMLLSFFTEDVALEFAIFVLGGVILMILTKPTLEKLQNQKQEKLNLERIIGMTGVVTEEIKKNNVGEIKADGKRWSAISEKKIPVDTEVIIEAIDGVKLLVKKKEEKIEEEKEPDKKKTNNSKKKTTNKNKSQKNTTKKKEKES